MKIKSATVLTSYKGKKMASYIVNMSMICFNAFAFEMGKAKETKAML